MYSITRFDWPAAAFCSLKDSDNVPELHFGSSLEQNSFKGFSTYQNDGAPRNVKYAIKRFNFNDPFQEKSSRILAIKGMIKEGTSIDVDVLLNAGFLAELTKTIESDGVYVSSNTLNSIGAFALGTNPVGATLAEVSDLKSFLVYLDIGDDYGWNDIQLIFNSDTDGGTYLISSVAFAPDAVGYASRDDLTI